MVEPQSIVGVLAAAMGGLAVGVERQWSGHATSHFAGIRTFTLLGGLAGLAGWLWGEDAYEPAIVLLSGAVLLVIAAYVASSRRDLEGTTEVAALVVAAAGFLAGTGELALASGAIAITVLMLVEKSQLHELVARINDDEIHAAARFAVMAVVILPLLPSGPYGPFGGIRPRALWAVVLLFTGLSFVGYILRRVVGTRRGYAIAGLLGGLISSTQVTLAHARLSRSASVPMGISLASGAIAASTMLFLRTTIAAAVLSPAMAVALLRYTVPGAVAGVAASAIMLRRARDVPDKAPPPTNPLQLRGALQMALLFQIVLMVAAVMRESYGRSGLLVTAALVGCTDVDAVTISMARSIGDAVSVDTAALAVAVGMLSNTLLKLGMAATIGSGRFRIASAAGLTAIGAAVAGAIALWHP